MGEAGVEALQRGCVEQGAQLVAIVRQTATGRSSGLQVETRLAHVWTVTDGKAVRWEAVPEPDDVPRNARGRGS